MLYSQFVEQLNSTFFPVVVIEGEDAFLRDDTLQRLKSSLNLKLEELNVSILSGDDVNVSDVLALANSFPIMSDKRLIVLKDFMSDKKFTKIDKNLKRLVDYCETPNEATCLVFLYNTGNCYLPINCQKVDCKKQKSYVVAEWIRRAVVANNKNITKPLAEQIANYCNCDMGKVNNSVNKLLSYCKKEITADAIELLVPKDLEVIIFDLSNAICAKQSQKALEVCQKLLIDEPPIKILQVLHTSFRRMFFSFLNSNVSSDVLAEKLSVSVGAVAIAKEQSEKFGAKKLREAIRLCSNSNFEITNFFGNDKMILNDLVLSLCNL